MTGVQTCALPIYARIQKPPVKVISRQFTKPDEISIVSSTVIGVDAFYVGGDNKLVKNIKLLLNIANNKKIPVFASDEGSVREGAIAAYSINYTQFGIKTAELSMQVLKNRKSTGINVIMYDKGECVINKTSLDKLNINFSNLKGCKVIN